MKYYLSALLLLSACRSYHPHVSEIEVPIAWKEPIPQGGEVFDNYRFWEVFEDPLLNALEEEAITGNFDLQIAAYRIEEAQSFIKKERAERFPHVDMGVSIMNDETLLNPRSFGSPQKLQRVQQRQYNFLSDFSYELDLWGKLKAKEKSARYRWEASKWEREFIYQTMTTDIALHYFTLRTIEEEIMFLRTALESWKDTVALNESRIQAGLEPEVNLARAKQEAEVTQTTLQRSEQAYAREEHILALLVGKPASTFSIASGKLPTRVPGVPHVLPSQVLLRRPDVKEAQALVSAGRSDVDVALREYFPSFALTSSLGLSTPVLSHFFEWQARYWSYALNVLQPLFDGGKRRAMEQLAKARFFENFVQYQKTVSQAFKDVEDAISDLHYRQLQYESQMRAVEASIDTFFLSKERFDGGLISYLLVADADRNTINIRREAIALKGERIMAWIRLMKATGIQRDEEKITSPLSLKEKHQ